MPALPAGTLAKGSIAVAVAVLGLKALAWALTGSVALLSDALESVVNVGAAVAAFIAVRLADRPADRNHPYGHHKAEYFAAVLEGALIIVAAIAIAAAAIDALTSPREVSYTATGLGVNALASVLNGAWAWLLIRRGRELRSPALAADGRHLMADVVSSVGVLAGVLLAAITGWQVLDPILALLVAGNVLWSGGALLRSSVGGLMDEAVSPELLARIHAAIAESGGGALQAHDIRTRHAGRVTFVDFHLVVPGSMSVSEAHDICDAIEARLREETGEAVITIHVEPEEKAKRHGVVAI